MASPAPRIGLFGTFDLENFGDMLLPRIAERELRARLPEADIRFFGPLGYSGLNRFDDGREVEALGAWGWERCSELAAALDVVVIGGGEIIHDRDDLLAPHYGLDEDEMRHRAPSRFFIEGLGPQGEDEVPVVWNAVGIPDDIVPEDAARFRDALERRPYVAVREEASMRRLRTAGVASEVLVVPDPAFVVERLFDPELLDRRLDYLRLIGRMPPSEAGEVVVVQANRDQTHRATQLAEVVASVAGDRPVVAISAGPCHGDDAFAEAFSLTYERVAGERAWVPGDAVGLADLIAIVRAAGAVVASSFHVCAVAEAYARPYAVLALDDRSKLSTFGETVGVPRRVASTLREVGVALAERADEEALRGLQKRIDAHFDRIAEVVVEASWRRGDRAIPAGMPVPAVSEPVEGELEQLRAALEVRGRRLVDERLHLADDMQELRTELARTQERLDAADERIADLEGQLGGARQELADLRSTALWRYSQGLRRVYALIFMPIKRRMQRRDDDGTSDGGTDT